VPGVRDRDIAASVAVGRHTLWERRFGGGGEGVQGHGRRSKGRGQVLLDQHAGKHHDAELLLAEKADFRLYHVLPHEVEAEHADADTGVPSPGQVRPQCTTAHTDAER